MEFLDLPPIAHVSGTVRMPGSKSISNRMLLVAALAAGTTELDGLLESDDTQVMLDALKALGIAWHKDASGRYVVAGCGGPFPNKHADLFVGLSGLSMRPLTAALAFSSGNYRLDGVARMRERPIGDLVDALRALGAEIRYERAAGFPPLLIGVGKAAAIAHARIRGNVSSQFLTGLLQASPLLPAGATIDLDGDLISKPYVAITLNMIPDAAMTAAIVALFAQGPTTLRNIGSWRVRETDRIAAMATELRKLGAIVDAGPDWLRVTPPVVFRSATIDTYDDHRIAMCF